MSAPVLINITGLELENRIAIYPNPASTEIHIKGILTQESVYTIHGVSGVEVAHGQIQLLPHEATIALDHLSPGVYYLSISTVPGKKWKIVVQ